MYLFRFYDSVCKDMILLYVYDSMIVLPRAKDRQLAVEEIRGIQCLLERDRLSVQIQSAHLNQTLRRTCKDRHSQYVQYMGTRVRDHTDRKI